MKKIFNWIKNKLGIRPKPKPPIPFGDPGDHPPPPPPRK